MLKMTLSTEEIRDISSEYLNTGRKQESWEITAIEIDGQFINAGIRMSSTYQSVTDENRFHLTIFSTLEFLSQLIVIYFHVWAGLHKKTREVWMIDSRIHCKRSIRDPDDIRVSMEFMRMRKVGERIYATAIARVYDNKDGLFDAHLKAFLA